MRRATVLLFLLVLAGAVFAQQDADSAIADPGLFKENKINIISVVPKDGSNGNALQISFVVDPAVKTLYDLNFYANGEVMLNAPEFSPENRVYAVELGLDASKDHKIILKAQGVESNPFNYSAQANAQPIRSTAAGEEADTGNETKPASKPAPKPPAVNAFEFYSTIGLLALLLVAAIGFLFLIGRRRPHNHGHAQANGPAQSKQQNLPAIEAQPALATEPEARATKQGPAEKALAKKAPAPKPKTRAAKPKAKKEIKGKAQIKRGKRK